MGTIYKRTGANQRKSRKNWVAQTRVHGRTRSRSFHEKAEAKNWLAQTEGRAVVAESAPALAQRSASDELNHLFTVDHALELYSTAAPRHVSKLTWAACQAPIVAYWRKQPLARRAISDVFRNDIKEWITKSRAARCPAGTIRKRLNILKQAIDLGLERAQSSQAQPCSWTPHQARSQAATTTNPRREKCAVLRCAGVAPPTRVLGNAVGRGMRHASRRNSAAKPPGHRFRKRTADPHRTLGQDAAAPLLYEARFLFVVELING